MTAQIVEIVISTFKIWVKSLSICFAISMSSFIFLFKVITPFFVSVIILYHILTWLSIVFFKKSEKFLKFFIPVKPIIQRFDGDFFVFR